MTRFRGKGILQKRSRVSIDVETLTNREMPVTAKLIPAELRSIFEKVIAGERVTDGECERLYHSNDLNSLGSMANAVRERKNGNIATYIHNQYINSSNACASRFRAPNAQNWHESRQTFE